VGYHDPAAAEVVLTGAGWSSPLPARCVISRQRPGNPR
jgi:hypothetical protein